MTGTTRRILKGITLTALCLLAALQLAPAPARTNPPVVPDRRFEAHVQVPPDVQAVLRRSCYPCHSNETPWPWYSYVAPASWQVGKDVNRARAILNFSEWSTQAGRTAPLAASILAASCSDIKAGRMPEFGFAMLHSETRMTKEETDAFCAWTKTESRRLLKEWRQKRAALKAAAAAKQ